ncbi:sensor histidine kinase [Paenibacillus sp. FSL H7-0331]|uniref:sensor histidine kinase n=2 Tax=Paenibacillus sp. FSL H7-0331 TaxID=1920421 RepID=UPI00096C6A99|nr:histidine kinase [Paenibacillus sp. FSL H7-0331]OMF06086.1 hypothetical protein BK127_31605 [Paenibacillus sp. FSL H7-0331]
MVHDTPDGLENNTRHPRLYSYFSKLQTLDGETFAYLRISLDIMGWLTSITNGFQVKQTYYIMDGDGNSILKTQDQWADTQPQEMLSLFRMNPLAYVGDSRNLFIYNGIYLPNTDWYLVNRFPLEALSGNIRSMKNQVMISLSITVVIFIGITFAIVSTLLRPLRKLQNKMTELVERNLDVRIPESTYKGEILLLAQAFNQMIDDIGRLISRLRVEERQKEAIRFQMLMSQMNPHFLLNTLNTVKWNARSHDDTGTFELCQNLGRLLECSLNIVVDLVHLKDEIDLVKVYVHIQSFRYDHTFVTEYEMEEVLAYALVPKLSLQPLVENAIYHGLVHMKAGEKSRYVQ